MTPPEPSQLSVLVERLLALPPDRWQPALTDAAAGPATAAEVLAILNAVSARLNGYLPTPADLAAAIDPPSRGRPPAVPGYEILGELGRGGMGVVYKARQLALDRVVALKTCQAGAEATAADQARFRVEAEAVARLQHPHIVTLYEFGRHEGLLYFTLECVEGGSLAEQLAGGPLPADEAARLVEQVAAAVQFAHDKGILHRDLKPGNVLLCSPVSPRPEESRVPEGRGYLPKVTDFGLAKRRAANPEAVDQTTVGTVLGTPSYVAPELLEAGPRHVGPAADVYGLGAILYACVTGRPPFGGATVVDTLARVRDGEPVAPRRLNPAVPPDLETICLKCLRKEPGRRYPSARALAEDLRRFQENRPIQARPVGRVERAWRWCRRNPSRAALTAVSCASLVLLSLGGLGVWRAQEIAGFNARAADTEKYASLVSAARERITGGRMGWTWDGLGTLEQAARLRTPLRDVRELRNEAAACLAGIDFRKTAVLHPSYPDCALAWRPDGKVLAAGRLRGGDPDQPRTVLLLDPATGRTLHTLTYPADAAWCGDTSLEDGARCLTFSREGQHLALGTRSGWIYCWHLKEEPFVRHGWRVVEGGDVDRVIFSVDGRWLYSLSRKQRDLARWDVAGGGKLLARSRRETDMYGLALAWDQYLASRRDDGGLEILHPETFSQLPKACNGKEFTPYCITADLRFAAGESEGRIQLVEVEWSGRVLRTMQDPYTGRAHDQLLGHLSFDPTGALLLSASHVDEDRTLKLWDVASGRVAAEDVLGTRRFYSVAWHPDGRSFAVSLDDREIALYELGGLHELTTLAGRLQPPLEGFVMSADGSLVACGCGSETWVRSSATGNCRFQTYQNRPGPWSLAFHPQLPAVAVLLNETTISSWNLDRSLKRHFFLESKPDRLAFAPDGKALWGITDGDGVSTWTWPDGRPASAWQNDPSTGRSTLYCLAVGRQVAVAGGRDGKAQVFRTSDARHLTAWAGPGSQVRSVALSPDEAVAALGTQEGTVRLVEVATGEPVADLTDHQGSVEAVAFRADGRLLATGSRDRTIRLYGRPSRPGDPWQHRITLRAHGTVAGLAFHPDGRRLFFLVPNDLHLRVWHLDRLRDRLAQLGLLDDGGGW